MFEIQVKVAWPGSLTLIGMIGCEVLTAITSHKYEMVIVAI